MAIDAALIQRNGWRQGSVFTLIASRPIVREHRGRIAVPDFVIDDDARLLLTSHDCDVVHPGIHEPRIEVCPAVALNGRLSGNFTGTRNPRRLHIELEINGANRPYELRAPTRFDIDREILQGAQPDPEARITPRHRDHFLHWLAKRFRRAALPTAFDGRISSDTRRALRALIDPLTDSIDTILIALNPDDQELEPDTPYVIQIVALMSENDFTDVGRRSPVEEALGQIQQLIDRCPGIELEACVAESASSMTIDVFREFVIWDYDDLSLNASTSPPRPLP
jgi:hypothetical protein